MADSTSVRKKLGGLANQFNVSVGPRCPRPQNVDRDCVCTHLLPLFDLSAHFPEIAVGKPNVAFQPNPTTGSTRSRR
jgi:hypothetical protein